jgi:N-acetylglucosaminyldiphosphoundecaprenol N-acetyl-beta-D-mannosaminyltransferase
MDKINMLRARISILTYDKVLLKIKKFLRDGKQHYIVTPNPEILLKASIFDSGDEELAYILNRADLALADGMGVKLAGYLMGFNIPRITGADLTPIVLGMAEKKGYRVTIIKPKDSLASEKEINDSLRQRFPSLKFNIKNITRKDGKYNYEEIDLQDSSPDILVTTLGSPHQEKIIYHTLKNHKNIKLALAVGGALDFLAGKIKRAPKFLRKTGLEWLWRLIKQPKRIKRIYNAVILFPYHFMKWRFLQPFLYRRNVACLLYKREGEGYKIFIVERRGQKGHWQIPQGGVERESVMKAGSRELKEELNCDKFIPKKVYKLKTKYPFPFKKKKGAKGGYKGQKQDLFIAEFTGKNEDIKINYWDHKDWMWADTKNIINYISPVRRNKTRMFLEKFFEYVEKNHLPYIKNKHYK